MLRPQCLRFLCVGQEMRLNELKIGQRALIRTHDDSGRFFSRFAELGLTPGAQISLIRKSVFGSTLQIEVRKTLLCLRREEAELFLVQPL